MDTYLAEFLFRRGCESISVELTCGYGPIIQCDGLDELVKVDQVEVRSVQYAQAGNEYVQKIETGSWLLGYRALDPKKVEKQWWAYVNEIIHDGSLLDGFPAYAFYQNQLQVNILEIVFNYGRANLNKKHNQICDTAIRYIIVAFTITRVLNLTWECQTSNPQFFQVESVHPPHIQSRPLTRQLKYILGNILENLRKKLLEHMYKLFRAKKTDGWATALAAFIVLAVGLETHQTSCQLIGHAELCRGNVQAKTEADQECAMVDDRFRKLIDYFGRCFKGFNPIFNPDDRELLDPPSQILVDSLRQLISSSADSIREETQPLINEPVELHPARNAARLVSKLLHSFIHRQPASPMA